MKRMIFFFIALFVSASAHGRPEPTLSRTGIILDTDANNELDDQHALAYLLLNTQAFNVLGVTVNATHGGGAIERHYDEAYRVLQLCGAEQQTPLLKGANADFVSILPMIGKDSYDGKEAVEFIINKAKQATTADKLTIIAVGKLTNIALALKSDPAVASNMRVVWLGGNYPQEGEYNLKADTAALNYVLKNTVEFEMVTVRYGKDSGSDAVRIKQATIQSEMPGKGPTVPFDVIGRHGGKFRTFGDYSVSLFEHISYKDKQRTRALFDVVPLAIVKNPTWGKSRLIPSPLYIDGQWVEQAHSNRYITLWEHFDGEAIVQDFLSCFQHAAPATDGFLADRWSFEDTAIPLANSARTQRDTSKGIQKRGDISFSDGLAELAAGTGRDDALEGRSGAINQKEFTVWMRLKLSSDSLSPTGQDGKSEFLQVGGIKLYYLTDKGAGKGTFYGLDGNLVAKERLVELSPPAKINIDFDSWIQVALTKKNEQGFDNYRVYCRIENANKNLVNWVYLGHLQGLAGDNGDGLAIGNLSTEYPLTRGLLIDELRCYERCLNDQELLDIWPSLTGFGSYPEKPYGTIIDYSPAKTGRYIAGSPSIAVLDDGSYLAKGDDYGPAVGVSELARIYKSVDNGASWKPISEVEGITWATLFTHRGAVYLIGTSAGHGLGHAIIMKSNDGGVTWTQPIDADNGLLFSDLSYHTAPVPVIIHNGRIWRAMEDEKGEGGWGKNFRALMLSAPVDADLMKASNWTVSEPLGYNAQWLDRQFNGWLEGNAVVSPQGNIVNMLRVSMTQGGGKAAIIRYDAYGKKPNFDPQQDFIDFPGGSTKFHVLFDSVSNRYWALSNAVLKKHENERHTQGMIRNTLVLMCSADLAHWEIIDTVLYHPDVAKHGFQYPAFAVDGEDIVLVSRTAYHDDFGGAFRQHDVNYFTFHRIRQFRKLLPRKEE
ncbi:nucleoside hydrolase [Parapedobacter koreensis]|uniref:Inosine-uridine preferring nucleoside hydrolase n=1 Tax=Parapedobacter koreensis TaxID=332977 RepID=A0A1H7PDM7_9SPHI|nr:nucleoside hydrolase [Parapedobacter koreensis]SEL33880.1 Inosine-uridine preferring nucleoside hydrolase [Parapedobacter koreensis]